MLIFDDFFTIYASQISFALLFTASITLIGSALAFKITRRKNRLKTFAAKNELGYRYTAEYYIRHLAGMPLAKNNPANRMRNFLSGGMLENAVYFDFFCRVPVTLEWFSQSVVCFHAEYDLPDFYLMPKEAPFRVPAAAGRVRMSRDFDAKYSLYSTNPIRARALFLRGPENFFCNERGWSVEFRHNKTLVYRSGVLYSAFLLADFINKAFEVYLMTVWVPSSPNPAQTPSPADSARASA
ncbi:MAG: hypothetical protein PHW69_09640 [Elusimicrobiaceae bacterium]|nr:hypothetical protein [Elusimicrobiaceae bacterium]